MTLKEEEIGPMDLEDSCDSGYMTDSLNESAKENSSRDAILLERCSGFPNNQWTVKYVVVGDERVGKTFLVKSFVNPGELLDFRASQYSPTMEEKHVVRKKIYIGNENEDPLARVALSISDTGGNEELDRLRPLMYSQIQVILLCFSVVLPSSFRRIKTKWMEEINRHTVDSKALLFLIGTQADLRSNLHILLHLAQSGLSPVSESAALKLADKIGAAGYIECSAFNKFNVKNVFEQPLKKHLNTQLLLTTPSSHLSNSNSIVERQISSSCLTPRMTQRKYRSLNRTTKQSYESLKQSAKNEKRAQISRQSKFKKISKLKRLIVGFPWLQKSNLLNTFS